MAKGLCFMDTVGNAQLDLPDVEAIFSGDDYDPGDVDNYLRNVTLYLLGLDRPLHSGEEIDGPGETGLAWRIDVLDQGALDPPRGVIRLCLKAIYREVEQVFAAVRAS